MARLPRRGVRGFAGRWCRLFQEKEPALPVPWASAPLPQAHPLVCSARVRRQLVTLEKTGRSFTAASWKELEGPAVANGAAQLRHGGRGNFRNDRAPPGATPRCDERFRAGSSPAEIA